MLPNWKVSAERLVAPSLAASCPPLSHFSSLRLLYLPLRVTLTHFALSSYERAFRLPTSFLILGLARFGVQPKLYRLSWRAFASIHRSCFLLLLLGRLSLLALPHILETCLPLLWSPPFPLHAPALIPFSLAHLDSLFSHNLVLWTNGSVSIPFGKGGFGVLANCFLCGTETTLIFSAGLVRSRFLQKLRHFAISCSTNKPAISLSFSYLTLILSLPLLLHLSFYLKLSGRFGKNCLLSSPVLSYYNGSQDISTREQRG